jgi:hypothetical protein
VPRAVRTVTAASHFVDSMASRVSSGEMTLSEDGVKSQLSSEIPVYKSLRLQEEQSDRGRTIVRLLSSISCNKRGNKFDIYTP